MRHRKNILAIVGSAAKQSSNLQLVKAIQELLPEDFELTIIGSLSHLPHFDPFVSADQLPDEVVLFRKMIQQSDGIIICTPEYIFSIPAVLKNAFEWCVATTAFAQKPAGLITASASGVKGHEELQLIMKTLEAKSAGDTTLLIQGIKSRFDSEGKLTDATTELQLKAFVSCFEALVYS
jgi:chromate reductase